MDDINVAELVISIVIGFLALMTVITAIVLFCVNYKSFDYKVGYDNEKNEEDKKLDIVKQQASVEEEKPLPTIKSFKE